MLVLLAGLAVAFAPPTTASFAAAWERHVIAEGRGDTAQAIGLKVGRSLALDPANGAPVRVIHQEGDTCVVSHVGLPVSCDARVRVAQRTDGTYKVVVRHRNERFIFRG
ncbi:hypothetical protein EXE59_09850 [Nocardioides eburneiflavus]|uniref:Uncharacterized protein n=1 Tax=Nocardioides eburneiflavus TaxID=2518372 RepID=A0A4Z1C4Z2_9ACTN|nr:hypothetical protein [Nocardioides eburneiflavus]TGN64222.1 hypothetical protein EXE59_09850 [Nocardioides eburneiflavus]